MTTEHYKGIFPALLTPMKEDDAVDYEAYAPYIDHLLSSGVKGFYVGGSTAESFILTEEERMRVLEAVVRANSRRATIIAHVGAIGTAACVRLARHAEQTGAHAVSAVVPFYYKTSVTEVRNHYLAIMNAVRLPLIIYHFPDATGVSLPLDFYTEMARHPQCIGVKFTSMNLFEMQQIRAHCGENFLLYNGYDQIYAAGAITGADGAIGSTFNMMPRPFADMHARIAQRDWHALPALQTQANEVIAHMKRYDTIPYEKYICYLQGWFRSPKSRMPLKQLSGEEQESIRRFYEQNSLLQREKRGGERGGEA